MTWGLVVVAGATLIGAGMAADAAEIAANTQAGADAASGAVSLEIAE